ncbi:DUF3276 family protein [Treponema zioleckii]|uniref:DUF3276 family protein n=1 Tax=Treponema zioleckii TaxID=331680 RepID=UPI00168AC605|nr:DUF3276 family protein [Treponema zioleckii]
MGIRGELFTTQVTLENRSYFFNVKENRAGDVFLQIVESKKGEGADFDRHQIAIFAEDMQQVLGGLDASLKFIEKDRKEKAKIRAEKKAAKDAKFGAGFGEKKIYRRKGEEPRKPDGIKRTGRVIHVVSKREDASKAETNSEN